MKRRLMNSLIIFLISLTLCSCSLIDNSSENSMMYWLFMAKSDRNSENLEQQDYASIKIKVKDFDSDGRTLLPSPLLPSDVDCFRIYGNGTNSDGDPVYYSELWMSYEDLTAADIKVPSGDWNFILMAEKIIDSDLYQSMASASASKKLSVKESATLEFELMMENREKASFSIQVDYPAGKAESVKGNLYRLNGSYFDLVKENVSVQTAESKKDGFSSVRFFADNISDGYYYLKIGFYKSGSIEPFCIKMVHMKLISWLETTSELTYDNINTPYMILYANTSESNVVWNSSSVIQNEFSVDDHVILPVSSDISRLNYQFDGWYEDSEFTKKITGWDSGTYSRDVTVYAKWIPDVYNVTYNDWANGGTTGKDFSGKVEALPVSHTYDADTIIPVPETTVPAAENQVVFYGWFTDKNCTKELTKNASGDYVLKNRKHTADITLYAKWESKYVYLDPVSGNDNNTGFSKTDALKTLSKARSGLAVIKAITDGKQLRVCNTITNPLDIVPLSNLTAPDCGNAVVMRYTKNVLINASSSVPISISNVKFDGGAVWKDNDPSKENLSEYGGENSSALIALNNNNIVATFTNCEFVNNDTPADSALIASGSNVTLDGCVFTKNKGRILSLLLINNLAITGNTSITGNSNDYDISCSNAMEKIKLGNVQVDSIYLGSLIKFELTEKLTDKHIKLDFPVSSKGKQILFNPDGNDFVSSSYNQFELVGSCAENGFTIDDAGYIIGSDSGSIVPEIYKPYKIQCSATEVSSSENTAIEFKLTDSDSAMITVNSWSFKLYSYGQDKTLQASGYITANSTAGSYIVTVGPGLPPGINLQLYVSGIVGSKAYDGVFDLTVR